MSLNAGGNSHNQSILYGGGPSLTNSSGVPWNAAYVDGRGDPTCDLRSNIAADSRAKIISPRPINLHHVPGAEAARGPHRRESCRAREAPRVETQGGAASLQTNETDT